MTQGGQI